MGWSDRVVELYDKDRNYITFKSPTTFGLTVRNEFESLLTLSNAERDELIAELEMDHTCVQKTRHCVAYSTPEGIFALEIDEYANGTLVLEMESASTAPLCSELAAIIDKEISGDAKFLNSNWKHMKTL
jgi:CYTH domain-containing protein